MSKTKITSHFIRFYDKTDKEFYVHYFDTRDEMLTHVSKIYCFGDLDDSVDIRTITTFGQKITYAGWQPNMVFEFRYKDTGRTCWIEQFPNWEH